MKSYEKESLKKSFTLFFSVQFLFLSLVIYQHYQKILHEHDMHVSSDIMQCHMNDSCALYTTTILNNIHDKKLHTFYKEEALYMLFKDKEHYVKIQIPKALYLQEKEKIQIHILGEYILFLLLLVLVSLFFALYALRPLKKALHLNEEFVKDILHDFNTPISSLKINLKILEKKFVLDDAIQRSNEAIENILSLQKNLHYYLKQNKVQNDSIELSLELVKKVEYFKNLFPNISLHLHTQETALHTNKDALLRIIDNLISNACKYNTHNGEVFINLHDNILSIQDTGLGITRPKEVFTRHYTENKSGIGIGLHIVKKLSDELHIPISLESEKDLGSTFTLTFPQVMLR